MKISRYLLILTILMTTLVTKEAVAGFEYYVRNGTPYLLENLKIKTLTGKENMVNSSKIGDAKGSISSGYTGKTITGISRMKSFSFEYDYLDGLRRIKGTKIFTFNKPQGGAGLNERYYWEIRGTPYQPELYLVKLYWPNKGERGYNSKGTWKNGKK